MTYQEILENARKKLSPKCRVCPECNGIACRGVMPGPGGKGSAATFTRNVAWLTEHVFLEMDAMGKTQERETTISLFGKEFSAPIFAAPIGLLSFNYMEGMTDCDYCDMLMRGTKQAGTIAFGGGGPRAENFYEPLDAIRANDGWGIPTLKPWSVEVTKERLREAEAVHPIAFAMDIDSAGLLHANLANPPFSLKSEEDLAEIAKASALPFIIKGIMTAETAVKAARTGAYAIVVSNHGGRVMDHGLSAAEVLPEIRAAVGDRVKIFVDGGIRSGDDVFKMLALGADAVLIGRPYVVAAYGGGAEGVRLYTEKLKAELRDAMAMTNCKSLQDITRDKIRLV